ncbi:MAG: tRNA pseudouridine(38-40) synthase TruA [Clostridia bacterium]|nr:tRNA pseudouridine(38-40) synthase TruA [Clostridia bacterium]
MKVLLTVAYDGSGYYGWQIQNNFVTVQQKIEEALSELLHQKISVRGASRTDTGVHAMAQGAVFNAETTIPVNKIPYALNSFLPDDIVITGAREVSEEFHPQYSVIDKTYEYKILNSEFKNPKLVRYTDFVRYKLDIDKMKEACKYFIGEHDFKAFCASGSTAKTTVRTIYSLEVKKEDDIITISVTGSGFLYNMVRIIAGTLVYVGLGKIKPNEIENIINSRDRTKAGKTLAPNGLTLMEVRYGE